MLAQDAPRRPSAVHFLSSFLQGRRHSTSDPILRLQQARRGSAAASNLLSSSSLQVMVAVSSVSHAEGSPTFPERKRNSGRPTAKYTKVGERLRHVIPGHMACSMACGGRACKYENPARWSEQEQAIKGVYSSWITDNILAMARPSSELLEKYRIIEQFLGLLLDLTENRPVVVKDVFEGPSLSAEIEKTVSEMVTVQLNEGLLRHDSDTSDPFPTAAENPGVILPCERGLDPLWKRRNVEYLQPLTRLERRLSYSDSDLKRAAALLEQGETPWTVPAQVLLCQNLRQQKPVSHCCTPQSPGLELNKEAFVRGTFSFWNQSKVGGLEGPKDDESPLFHRKDIPKEIKRSRTFSAGVSGSHNPGEPFTPSSANVHKDPNPSHQPVARCRHDTCGWGPASIEEDSQPHSSPLDGGSSPRAQFSDGHETHQSKELSEAAPHTALPSEPSVQARRILAAKALANLNEFVEKEEVKRKVEMWQKELNSRDGAWERICGEKDPFILCSLMWSWVEQLKEPVITKEDVDMLIDKQADAAEALFLLEKGQQQTILCVLHCIVNLQTLPVDVEEAVLAHAIKAFTKVKFDSENGPLVYNTLKKIFKHTLEEKRKIIKNSPKPGL
ncbi:Protein tyrosine phosphatase domain-containing protein 1 [Tupaia chinensis]|uniref:Protein tyrosine phosphatase domain-containing protein 1 n=1 Tax=Tupaia chinensis TaxID=246437 RepID=L8Y7J7_TUPCH|nr:Protein tyrosine phosphatase domain-containing protein 1 [Tupaia chinensis]